MMVPPGWSLPSRSASSTILAAIRSLMEPPGFTYSSVTRTVALMPSVTWLSLISGVLPIRSRTDWAYFMGTNLPSCPQAGVPGGSGRPEVQDDVGSLASRSLCAPGGEVLPQPQNVPLSVLEVGVEAHPRDGVLRLDHGAAELLHLRQRFVDALHIDGDDGGLQLTFTGEQAAVNGPGTLRHPGLLVAGRGNHHV